MIPLLPHRIHFLPGGCMGPHALYPHMELEVEREEEEEEEAGVALTMHHCLAPRNLQLAPDVEEAKM